MELLKHKKICFLCLIFILLFGCSKEQSKFTLLFTSDYAYGNDYSFLVSFDSDGNIVENKKINGALHYNIINQGNDIILNNGKNFVTYETDGTIKEKEFENPLGYLEPNSYFIYNENPVYIYNTGFDDSGNYHTLIQDFQQKEIIVNGLVHNFSVSDQYLYLFVSKYESVDSDKYHMIKIDLDSFSIVTTDEITGINKIGDTSIHGVNSTVVDNNMILFKDLYDETSTIPKKSSMITISLVDYSIKEYEIDKIILDEGILYNTFFSLNNNVYFISKNMKIVQLDIKNDKLFIKTDLTLPDSFGTFPVLNVKDEKLYILEPGKTKYMIEVDIENKKISKPVKFQETADTKNLYVYSFDVK